jgi:membrane-bound lytic murein transglycosylase D
MARLRSGSGSILTVVFALITGLAVGSNPSFQPLAWARELFGRARPAVQAPAPAQSAQNAGTPARVAALLGRHTALPALGDFSDLDAADIDIPEEAEVNIYFRFFTENATGRALVERWLERRGRYRSFVDAALSQARLPRALEAVVLAESGYHPRALSPAGAVGLWQLMPETARAYGLAVEKGNDARRDPQSASDAAVRHLTMLRERLGSWELVLAAYNAGLSRIEDALRATGTKDYWALARTAGALPRETILYVPKVLALSLLLQNLDSFGFRDSGPLAQAPLPHTIGTPSSLTGPGKAGATRFAAQLSMSGGDEDGAGLLEPWLKKDSYAIVVAPPIGFSDASSAGWGDGDALDPALKETARVDEVLTLVGSTATKPIGSLYERSYRVTPGDTVSKIAATFGVEASQLVRHNRIDNPALVRVGQELRIPSHDLDGTAPKQQPLVTMYFASPGDTLSKIARSFGVSERDLILDNDLKNPGYVREGQILRVRVNRAHARAYLSHRLASGGDGEVP